MDRKEYHAAYNNFIEAHAKRFGLNESQKIDFALALNEAIENMEDEEE